MAEPLTAEQRQARKFGLLISERWLLAGELRPTHPARSVLLVFVGHVHRGQPCPSSYEISAAIHLDRRRVLAAIGELLGLQFLRPVEAGRGPRPDVFAIVWPRIARWVSGQLVFDADTIGDENYQDFVVQNRTTSPAFVVPNCTANPPFVEQNGTTASRVRVTAAAVGVAADGEAELRLIADEARRLMAKCFQVHPDLMPEVVAQLQAGSTLADFEYTKQELLSGPRDGKAWRTAKRILERLRRERTVFGGVDGDPNVSDLSEFRAARGAI